MLHSNNFAQVNLWPRGVDLSQFSPSKRSPHLRAEWGVGDAPTVEKLAPISSIYHLEPIEEEREREKEKEREKSMMFGERDMGLHFRGRKSSLPLTPPLSPAVGPEDGDGARIDDIISLSPTQTFSSNHRFNHGHGQAQAPSNGLPRRIVLIFVGRM